MLYLHAYNIKNYVYKFMQPSIIAMYGSIPVHTAGYLYHTI